MRFQLPALTSKILLWCCALSIATSAMAAEPSKKSVETKKAATKDKVAKKDDPYAWKTLFDGKTLKGWKTPEFFSDGKVTVDKKSIILGKGDGVTGVAYKGKPLRTNYEIAFQAKRLDGNDFFGTVTIPVGKEHCSVVIGGWGGQLIGISSIDGFDASENMTTTDYNFKKDVWYTIRVRTSDTRIETWIDKKQVIDVRRANSGFDTRFEVEDCAPLGFASWNTKGAIRNIRVRKLRPEEIKAAAKLRKNEYEDL